MSKLKSFTLILGVFTMSFLIGYLVLAWQEPTNYPPETNVSPPLNTSTNDQTKPAGLTFTTFWDYNQSQYFVDPSASFSARLSGDVGIGLGTTETPEAKLDIKPSSASALRIRPYGTGAGETGEIRFIDLTAPPWEKYIGFKAPDSLPGNGIYVLPYYPTSSGQYLKSTTSGVLSWDVPSVPCPLQISCDGSAAAPSYSFSDATNTGMYRNSTFNYLAFATGGAERMEITSTGNVGIGITNPQYKLVVGGPLRLYPTTASGVVNNGEMYYESGTGFQFYEEGVWKGLGGGGGGFTCSPSCTTNYLSKFTSASTIGDSLIYDDGTNVGIGTAIPAATLDINGNLNVLQPPITLGSGFIISASNVITSSVGPDFNWDMGIAGASTTLYISNPGSGVGDLAHLCVEGDVGIGITNPSVPAIDLAIGDTDTGFDLISDGNLALYTNNVERVRFDSSGNVGIGTTSPEFKLSLDNDGGIIAKGTYDSGATLATSGGGTRLIWYPRKAAFRAGEAWGSEWDDVNIGSYSFAVGSGTTASAYAAIAGGDYSSATGAYSVALGEEATASNTASVALGWNTTASGLYSTASGTNAVASGTNSVALGSHTTASGNTAIALGGGEANATGNYSIAIGNFVKATNNHSFAIGSGASSTSPLLNNKEDSLMVGFNSDIPTLYVEADPIGGAGTVGKVGIGTVNVSNILTVQQFSSTDPIADAWTTYSSRRWKENIQPIDDALNKVMQLRGVYFDWKKDKKHDIGMIAEEVGEVIPEVVVYEQNGRDAKSLDYSRLVAVLIEAMKEQQKEIDGLREEIGILKGN